MKFESIIKDKKYNLEFDKEFSAVEVNGNLRKIKFLSLKDYRFLLRVGLKTYILDNVIRSGHVVEFTMNNRWYSIEVKDEQAILLAKMGFQNPSIAGAGRLTAPMPGKVLDILVSLNDKVKQGDPLVILEAMKMENELKAPMDGIISSIPAKKGTSVDKKELLIELKAIG